MLLAVLLTVSSCGTSGKKNKTEHPAEETTQVSTVTCLRDQVPVREEPLRSGKWLSALDLGETVEYMGDRPIDEADNNQNYFKIRLSDGTLGWASDYGLVKGEVAAFACNTFINRRPDLLIATNVELSPMEFVVIREGTGEWVEVIGERKQKRGWIEARHIVTDREEVAIVVLARKNVFTTNRIDFDKLENFLEGTPFTQTAFYRQLHTQLEDHKHQQRLKKEVAEEYGGYYEYEDEYEDKDEAG